ncbi:unnamed protein product [Schistosoma mattheei]|uniref:Uncharacterized protein n=1 Tax=Schistosoma mattheei TaxID=31246 RepID=A0A3P8FQZ2_9TREM|nr:unnamed protein product [Schistosoma mattheei]
MFPQDTRAHVHHWFGIRDTRAHVHHWFGVRLKRRTFAFRHLIPVNNTPPREGSELHFPGRGCIRVAV